MYVILKRYQDGLILYSRFQQSTLKSAQQVNVKLLSAEFPMQAADGAQADIGRQPVHLSRTTS